MPTRPAVLLPWRAQLRRAAGAVLALALCAACTSLPEGVTPAPDGAAASAILTLPSRRAVTVNPDQFGYSGKARLEWADGRVYEGDWQDGRPHGQGRETLPDGTTYEGGWREGLRHGRGKLVSADGSRYRGEFKAGARHGRGRLQGSDGVYRGQWVEDLPHGRGEFRAVDGSHYQGEWRFGQRAGFGRYALADGSVYEGDWEQDQPHGTGLMEQRDGAAYDGEWRRGRQHGYGRSEGPPGLVYEGTWVDGQRQGFGREQRPDGSRYEGEWHAGKRHGQGRETHPDGSFHEGLWELNQALGPGRRRTAAGVEISGMWNHDSVSTGLLVLPTGLEYAGPLFSDGQRAAAPRLLGWLESAAGRGDPFAQLLLGTLYLDLEKPAPDIETARHWLSRAAKAGVAEAQYQLGLTYRQDNPARAVELLSAAALQDHPNANDQLGEYYHGGLTVPRNLSRAIRYYERALSAGSVHARNNLAWLLATSDEDGTRDPQRAVSLIRPIALYSGDWQYLDTLAAAWAAAGDFEQAVQVAERALEAARGGVEDEVTPAELAGMEQRLAGYRDGQPYVER